MPNMSCIKALMYPAPEKKTRQAIHITYKTNTLCEKSHYTVITVFNAMMYIQIQIYFLLF